MIASILCYTLLLVYSMDEIGVDEDAEALDQSSKKAPNFQCFCFCSNLTSLQHVA